jgi:hypothetical protein
MRSTINLLRVAAVCSSFLLVAGYVLYRSNAGVKALPGSKSMRLAGDGGDRRDGSDATTQAARDRVLFYGSKSGAVVLPTSQPAAPSTSPAAAVPATQPATAPSADSVIPHSR